MRTLIPLIAALLLCCTAGCRRTPDGVLPPERMAQLLADYHTGEAVADIERRTYDTDSARTVLRASVLHKYGVTEQEFDSSLMWYGKHMDTYAQVYNRVVDILDNRLRDQQARSGAMDNMFGTGAPTDQFELDGDSVDVWNGLKRRTVSVGDPNYVIPFRLLSDRTWERGDIYSFAAKVSGSTGFTTFAMAVEYLDGSTDYLTMRSHGNGWKRYLLPTDTLKTPRFIYGVLGYEPQPDEIVVLDSISLFRSRRSGPVQTMYPVHRLGRHN